MKYIIGIDIGTSGLKLLVINEDAEIVTKILKDYPISNPQPKWSEQNPVDWWNAAKEGLSELFKTLPLQSVCAIGLSGQMHGMVALDNNYNVIRPAILWNDQRTKKQCDDILRNAGGVDGMVNAINNTMLTGFTAGKILWMKENEPENYKKVKVIFNPKDYIAYKLTGNIATDVSDASGTGLFDVENRVWSKTVIDAAGINGSFLAPVFDSTQSVGTYKDIPVYIGGGDAVISAAFLGNTAKKQVSVTVGTSGVVSIHKQNFYKNKNGLVQFSCACIPDTYHIMGVTLAAAGSYKWFCEQFYAGDYKKADEDAEKSTVGANGVMFLPYLSGERCPVNDEKATGCFIGLKTTTTNGDLARAVLEGVAFSLKEVFDLLDDETFSQIVISGGGSKSPLWKQIFADVFTLPVVTLESISEGSGFGAALVAGIGEGIFNNPKELSEKLKVNNKINPQKDDSEKYKSIFNKYKKLYISLKNGGLFG